MRYKILMRFFNHSLCGAIIFLLAASHASFAEQAQAPLNVSASVGALCDLRTQPDIDLGTITSPTTQKSNDVRITIVCTGGISDFGVWIPLSSNANGNQRRMANTSSNAGYISYDLYTDSTFSKKYPTSITTTGSRNSPSTTSFLQIVGQIPGGQTVTPGYYVDQITVNVSF